MLNPLKNAVIEHIFSLQYSMNEQKLYLCGQKSGAKTNDTYH
jgi:hypothetical protein